MPAVERPILAFFWSNTCGHSRRMDSVIEHFARQHRDTLKIAKVCIEDRPDLAERFQIETAPTCLLLDGVNEAGRLEGRQTLPSIKDAFEDLFATAEETADAPGEPVAV